MNQAALYVRVHNLARMSQFYGILKIGISLAKIKLRLFKLLPLN